VPDATLFNYSLVGSVTGPPAGDAQVSKIDQNIVVAGSNYVISLFNAGSGGAGGGIFTVNVASPTAPAYGGAGTFVTTSAGGGNYGAVLGVYNGSTGNVYAGTNNGRIYLYICSVNTGTGALTLLNAGATLVTSVASAGMAGIDVATFAGQTYCYMTDISNSAVWATNVTTPATPGTPTSVATGAGGNPVGLKVVGNYLYVPDYTLFNLQVFSLATPSTPTPLSSLSLPGGQRPGSLTSYTVAGSTYLYVITSSLASVPANTLWIVDITNPLSIPTATSITLPTGGGAYNTGALGGPTVVQNYLYIGMTSTTGTNSNVLIYSLATPTSPALIYQSPNDIASSSVIDVDPTSLNIYVPNRSSIANNASIFEVYTTQALINYTNQHGSIGSATVPAWIYQPTVSAMFLVSVYALCTTAGLLGDTLTITLYWNDGSGARTMAFTALSLAAAGNVFSQTFALYDAAPNVILYSAVLAVTGTPVYEINIRAISLS
jgi:hypothetical protein